MSEFEKYINNLELDETTKRNLIALHVQEVSSKENEAYALVREKTAALENANARISALESDIAASKAKAFKGMTYEPPIIQEIKYE